MVCHMACCPVAPQVIVDVLDKEVLKDDHVGRCVMELSGARGLITLGTPCEHPGCLGGVRACVRVCVWRGASPPPPRAQDG